MMSDDLTPRLGAHHYSEAEARKALSQAFKQSFPLWWPCPYRWKPSWWQRRHVKADKIVNNALLHCGFSPLTEEMRRLYWHEIHAGQGYDDASGYVWRAWSVMLRYTAPGQAWVSPWSCERR